MVCSLANISLEACRSWIIILSVTSYLFPWIGLVGLVASRRPATESGRIGQTPILDYVNDKGASVSVAFSTGAHNNMAAAGPE